MLLLALAALFAAAAAPATDGDCRDDNGVDRCSAAAIARMERFYGVEPIAAFAARGEDARRTFYVDGYGRDVLVITFARRRGDDPKVEVRAPAQTGERQEVLQTALSSTD